LIPGLSFCQGFMPLQSFLLRCFQRTVCKVGGLPRQFQVNGSSEKTLQKR
jgi:hypothetical protein